MSTRIRSLFRHNAVAVLALFVALGGTSYAAIKLPANSVGSKQIKKQAVTYSKLSKSAKAALKGEPGQPGAPGASGAKGEQGEKGDPGTPATKLWAVVSNPAGAANAGLVRGSGVSAIVEGTYVEVRFDKDVSGCAWIPGRSAPNGAVEAAGFVQAHGGATPDSVRVATRTENGTITDGNFHLAVLC